MAKLTLDKTKITNGLNVGSVNGLSNTYTELQKLVKNNNPSTPVENISQPKNTYDQLVDIANGKTASTNPTDVKNSAQSVYDQMLAYYTQNENAMSANEKELAQTYLKNAQLDMESAQSLYGSYVEAYKNYADSKSSAQVARDNAYKYTQQALQRQGLGTQGLAQSTIAGIGNQYSRNVNNLNKQHNEQMHDIYSQYQNILRENKANAIADRNALSQEQAEQEALEFEEKQYEAITNIENAFANTTNSSSMKDTLEKNKNNLDEATYESYKQQYVATMLENSKIESTTDAMYNSFGSYFMNNEVPNGQVFVLENEKGQDAHYFEYQNGSLIELKKKDIQQIGNSYIHFDSKGNIENKTYIDYSSLANGMKTKVEKSAFKDATQLTNNTAFYSIIDGKEHYYVYKDGYIHNLATSKLTDSEKKYIKQNFIEYKK